MRDSDMTFNLNATLHNEFFGISIYRFFFRSSEFMLGYMKILNRTDIFQHLILTRQSYFLLIKYIHFFVSCVTKNDLSCRVDGDTQKSFKSC